MFKYFIEMCVCVCTHVYKEGVAAQVDENSGQSIGLGTRRATSGTLSPHYRIHDFSSELFYFHL